MSSNALGYQSSAIRRKAVTTAAKLKSKSSIGNSLDRWAVILWDTNPQQYEDRLDGWAVILWDTNPRQAFQLKTGGRDKEKFSGFSAI
jgi:hypothetical protein